jgi:hypothetical protein
MSKRVLLSLTFAAALFAAGLSTSNNAEAYGGCGWGGGYGGYYGASYPGYYSGWGYSPRLSYYRGDPHYFHHHHRHHHHGHHHHGGHHHGRSGVHFSVGF